MYGRYCEKLIQELEEITESGLSKSERYITSAQQARINDAEKQVLNMCANNYLGLANNSEIIEAVKTGLDERGFGMASVRFTCGTQDIHNKLEKKISDFFSTDDTILYSSCFDANTGLFETLLGEKDAVISDALNHVSIIDGIRLCKAARYRYDHGDMQSLENCLKEAAGAKTRMIATDGVFSFSNSVAPPIVSAALKTLDLLKESKTAQEKLESNTKFFREQITKAGFTIKPGTHPIIPIMLGDAKLAQEMAAKLLEEGVYAVGFFYPVVPRGQVRIRVQISAAHSKEDLEFALEKFIKVGRELNIISS